MRSKFDLYDAYPKTEEELNMPENFRTNVSAGEEQKSLGESLTKPNVIRYTADITKDILLKIDSYAKL